MKNKAISNKKFFAGVVFLWLSANVAMQIVIAKTGKDVVAWIYFLIPALFLIMIPYLLKTKD